MKVTELIGKEQKRISISFHPKDSNEFYILESLEIFCKENNFSQQKGMMEMLRIGAEEIYGMQRKSNNPIFHEKEYLKEKNRILKKGGRINNYELNKLKRDFVEERIF